jgi:hypothetical protein
VKLADRVAWLVVIASAFLLMQGGGGVSPFTPASGARHVVILRESGSDTPSFSVMVGSLRAGPQARYLKDKGHQFTLYDLEDKDQNGDPVKQVVELKALNIPPPALFVLDKGTGSVLRKETLPKPPTADAVIEAVKGTGG